MSNPFKLNANTILQEVLIKESNRYKQSFTTNSILNDPNNTFKGGNVCFRTIPKTKAFQQLLLEDWLVIENRNPDELLRPKHYIRAMDELTSAIITIDNAGNVTECLNKINNIKAALGKRFYGALLIKNELILNPLHPLTAISLLSDSELPSNNNYKLVIYTYKSEESRKELFEYYDECKASLDRINSNINNQLLVFTNKVHTELKTVDGNNTDVLQYIVNKIPGEYSNEEYYIVAHQIFTKGIVMPYYGTSVVKLGGKTSGRPLTPMRSCNIATNSIIHSTEWRNNETQSPTVKYGSVCTGSVSNKTLDGIRTLTHSNASSPYITDVMHIGALTYAEACVNKSLEIFTRANIIKEK